MAFDTSHLDAKMSLSSFPPEILGILVEYLSDEASSLLFSGDRVLTSKLRHPGTVKWFFSDTPQWIHFFLKSFPGLFYLDMTLPLDYPDMPSDDWRFDVDLLPKSLTTLNVFIGTEVDQHFSFGEQILEFAVGNLHNLTSLALWSHLGRSNSSARWIRAMREEDGTGKLALPHLETLLCQSFRHPKWLPYSLTSLTCHEQDARSFGPLPKLPNLVELCLDVYDWDTGDDNDDIEDDDHPYGFDPSKFPLFLTSLPPTLETLILSVTLTVPSNTFELLPFHLKKLDLSIDLEDSDPIPFPQHILDLSCKISSISSLAKLPLQLTRLVTTASTHSSIDPNYVQWLESLPHSLTELDITERYPESHDNAFCGGQIVKMPPKLESLILEGNSLNILQLASLPSTISNIKIDTILDSLTEAEATSLGHNIELSGEKLKKPALKFPSSLSSLSLKTSPSASILPSFLFELACHCPNLSNLFFHGHWSSWNRVPQRSSMPKENREQFLNDFNHLCALHGKTPTFQPKLAEFKLGSPVIGDEVVSMLPNSLTSLHIPDSKYITDLSIQRYINNFKWLNALSLGGNLVTGSSFKYLPAGLKMLSLPDTSSIVDTDMQYLPRGITYLNMDNAVKLSDALDEFPPQLVSLFLRFNDSITTAIFESSSYVCHPSSQHHKSYIYTKKWTAIRQKGRWIVRQVPGLTWTP